MLHFKQHARFNPPPTSQTYHGLEVPQDHTNSTGGQMRTSQDLNSQPLQTISCHVLALCLVLGNCSKQQEASAGGVDCSAATVSCPLESSVQVVAAKESQRTTAPSTVADWRMQVVSQDNQLLQQQLRSVLMSPHLYCQRTAPAGCTPLHGAYELAWAMEYHH